jgi:hypothetical protein
VKLKGLSPGAFLHPLLTESHSPHACSTPGICTFIVPQSIDCSTSPLRVSTTGHIKNSQSSVAGAGLSLGENRFPKNSLTWRELLTSLTTCLFNPQPPLSLGESVSHRLDILLLQLSSNTVRATTRFNKEQTTTTSHSRSRNCVATTTQNYDTTQLKKLWNTRTSQNKHGITQTFPRDTGQSVGFPHDFQGACT